MQLNRDILREAYSCMRLIREFENRVRNEFNAGEIPGFVHLYAGQEASAVGVCLNLGDQDYISSTHRGHGHCIAKGCDTSAMMAEIYGRQDGLCHGKGGSMHIADLDKGMLGANGIVGGGPPLICGAALTAKTKKTGGVAVAFVGDGGSNQGTTLESLNLASVLKLPAIFVIEDNGYAEATASSWACAGSHVERATGFGMPGELVDGTDFFAVYQAASEAVGRARNGDGPTLLHVQLGRFYGHFEGDAGTYRSQQEVQCLRDRNDCIVNFLESTIGASLLEKDEIAAIDTQIEDEINQAVDFAVKSSPPDVTALRTDVYSRY